MSHEELIQKYYIGFYGRPADQVGIQYWSDRADEEGVNQVLEHFATSPEAREFVYQDPVAGEEYSSEELVNNIYQNLFGRDAEKEGRDWYAQKIDSGEIGPINVVERIMAGAQDGGEPDKAVLENKLEVAQHFTQNVADSDYGPDQIPEARSVLEGQLTDVADGKVRASEVINSFLDEDDETKATLSDLAGTYELDEFSIEYLNQDLILTEDDFSHVNSQIVIDSSGEYAEYYSIEKGESSGSILGQIDSISNKEIKFADGSSMQYSKNDDSINAVWDLSDSDNPIIRDNKWKEISKESNEHSIEDLSGTYRLSGFKIHDIENDNVITDADYNNFYGEMYIFDTGRVVQDWTLDGSELERIDEEFKIIDDSTAELIDYDETFEYSYYDSKDKLVTYFDELFDTGYFQKDEWIKTSEETPMNSNLNSIDLQGVDLQDHEFSGQIAD